MIRITKMTDYGIVLLSRLASDAPPRAWSVRDLAADSHLPEPTVGKLLKALTRGGLLTSQRGALGGYSLSRPAREITVAQIIGVIDGPISITDCSEGADHRCELEALCPVRGNWQRINVAIRDSLSAITLADMTRPGGLSFVPLNRVERRTTPQKEQTCP